MGEIIGGIIVMGLFIAFIMWKAKNNPSAPQSDMQKTREQQYWAEKDIQKTEVVSSEDSNDNDDDDQAKLTTY